MKVLRFLLTLAVAAQAFQVSPRHATVRLGLNELKMGLFDFQVFHGSGSAQEDDLDDQWHVQQDILAARRGHLSKDHLKQKYKSGKQKFEVKATRDPHNINTMNSMYTDDDSAHHAKKVKVGKFKFPWDK